VHQVKPFSFQEISQAALEFPRLIAEDSIGPLLNEAASVVPKKPGTRVLLGDRECFYIGEIAKPTDRVADVGLEQTALAPIEA
jgi:hypothetical protein